MKPLYATLLFDSCYAPSTLYQSVLISNADKSLILRCISFLYYKHSTTHGKYSSRSEISCIRHLSNPLVHNLLTHFNFFSHSEVLIDCILSFPTKFLLSSNKMSVISHKSSCYECESVKAVE